MLNKFLYAVRLQQEVNDAVDTSWRSAGFPWYRAIWIECAELSTHLGYKWWKKEPEERSLVMKAAKLELADILAFGISLELTKHHDAVKVADDMHHLWSSEVKYSGRFRIEPLNVIDNFVKTSLDVCHTFYCYGFFRILTSLDLHIDELLILHTGKSVLNKFRQDHGYKDGTYIKQWSPGSEDNDFLYDICQKLSFDVEGVNDLIYEELTKTYNSVVRNSHE